MVFLANHFRHIRLCGAVFCAGLLWAGWSVAQDYELKPHFSLHSRLEGEEIVGPGIAGDFNNDGWPDLFMSELTGSRIALLHNEGGNGFINRTELIRANTANQLLNNGSICADYDNDGDLDIFIPVLRQGTSYEAVNMLLRNDRGTFADVALESGLNSGMPSSEAVWLDYDRDGHLDLYVGNWGEGFDPQSLETLPEQSDSEMRNRLYRNRGDGTFADVTEEAGLLVELHPDYGGSTGGMAAGDFNGDGWPDIYVGVTGAPNRLFINDGQGKYLDATSGEIDDPGTAFGIAVGDLDNDGDLDIFQAVIVATDESGTGFVGFRPVVLLNLGGGEFLDVGEGVGIVQFLTGTSIVSSITADFDSDGDLDLLFGMFDLDPLEDPSTFALILRDLLFLNNGDGTFALPLEQGFDFGLALLTADFDLDGFLDLMQSPDPFIAGGPWRFYRNIANENHRLWVELVGIASNRSGIGARVSAVASDLRQMREILGGLGGGQQNELIAHFGLGTRTRVDSLEIRWPSGQVDVLTGIPADQRIRVFEGRPDYGTVVPTTWVSLSDTLVAGRPTALRAVIRPALFEAGAAITGIAADLGELGGPSEVSLIDDKNGTYRLEAMITAEGRGWKDIRLSIEQTTSLGPYWTDLMRRIAVLPGEDLSLLDEALPVDWPVEIAGGVEIPVFSSTGPVYSGGTAGAVRSKPESFVGWSLTLSPPEPVDIFGYNALRFAFHPGDATGRALNVAIGDKSAALLGRNRLENAGVDLELKDWQLVEIPLDSLEIDAPIASINFNGDLEGTFYLDDLRLISAAPPATAVLEEHASLLPRAFDLDQNYPNPFNSGTVIRFSLPRSGRVSLSLYNLTGQRVATLLSGRRPAGTYTVRWDGRDEEGHALASGVYLYRLQADTQVETRKLLLVR